MYININNPNIIKLVVNVCLANIINPNQIKSDFCKFLIGSSFLDDVKLVVKYIIKNIINCLKYMLSEPNF